MRNATLRNHFNLPNHSKQHLAVCGLSLHQGSTESCKTLEPQFFFSSALLILTVSTNTYHSVIYSVVFHFTMQQPIYKPHTTHNSSIRSEEGLTLETSAFESLYGGQSALSTQLIIPNYLVILHTDTAPQFFFLEIYLLY